jgi:hypothetical protein
MVRTIEGLIESRNEYCKKAAFWKDFYNNVLNNKGVIKGFFDVLMERDISDRDWMQFPKTELRDDIIQASLHPIIYFMDNFIRTCFDLSEDGFIKISSSQLFDHYVKYCGNHNINCTGNCKGFGIIFKDNLPFDECGIVKVKSHGIMKLSIDVAQMFNWLKDNEYTIYDELPTLEIDEDEDDKI